MASPVDSHTVPPVSLLKIRQVASDRPWLWLAAGWNDFTRAPGAGMGYGLLVAAVMLLVFYLLQSIRSYHLALGLMAGFVFLGPVLAVGLYELSRRIAQHKPAVLIDTRVGWRRNTGSVLAMGVIMLLLMLTWFMLSMQLTAVLYGLSGEVGRLLPGAGDWQAFALSLRWPLLVAFTLVGVVAVVVAYVLTVVAVPLLTDEPEMDVMTAVGISVQTVRKNPATMTLWAVLLAIFSGIAVMPLFLGLIVVFPLLAFASWHAYRDLIEH